MELKNGSGETVVLPYVPAEGGCAGGVAYDWRNPARITAVPWPAQGVGEATYSVPSYDAFLRTEVATMKVKIDTLEAMLLVQTAAINRLSEVLESDDRARVRVYVNRIVEELKDI